MQSYLRKRFFNILQDKDRDKAQRLQNYFCSFILVYYTSISNFSKEEKKENIEKFLSKIFNKEESMISSILIQLHEFKDSNNSRDECMQVALKIN
ncbi:hypothetical protein A9726_07470 [Campylobacter helveticus]|uniref:Uncharacterized protein n=2 Tax=Campylobacter helveticus TaxID=28898 RepID=A0AAX2ULA4_9BACT|nr:hypothetical protein FDW42_01185 [Campylobacter helveticus]TNH34810.1 hypothetical protein FDW48_02310 [Campylobacter helveticus]TNH35058.1 hypothetical protein FDW46_02685 [Campylobacter helveticus]TXK51710.1 hypothetical protein A9726_07470 [Campylobacter helveticus]TXK57572.1 hypothetical protein FVD16_04890 [Campylobacter helveticus]